LEAGERGKGVGPPGRRLDGRARVAQLHGEGEAEALARRGQALARAGETRRGSAACEAGGERRHLALLPGEPAEEAAAHPPGEVIDPLAEVAHPARRVAEAALEPDDPLARGGDTAREPAVQRRLRRRE